MVEVTPRLVFLLVFLAGLAAFLYWDREKVSRHYFIFYRRTKRGIVFIDRIARKAPRFWNYYGWAAVLTGLLSVVLSAGVIGFIVFRIFFDGGTVSQGVKDSGLSFVAPGLVSEPQLQAGVSFIPAEHWVISIAVIMFVHEMSHGIVARAEDLELNSVGWILFGFIPGAFVEPKGENMLPGDETNQDDTVGMWEQGSWKSRLKVLGAGSLANYITGAVFLLAMFGFTAAIAEPSDVYYRAQPNYSAYDSGMRNGTLVQLNGHPIDSVQDMMEASDGIQVGETVRIWSSEGNFTVVATEKQGHSNGYIGISVGQSSVIKDSLQGFAGGLNWFRSLLLTVAWLNVAVGFFNMLPFKPLDGGFMAETVLQRYRPGWTKYLNNFSLLGWAFLLTILVAGIALML